MTFLKYLNMHSVYKRLLYIWCLKFDILEQWPFQERNRNYKKIILKHTLLHLVLSNHTLPAGEGAAKTYENTSFPMSTF